MDIRGHLKYTGLLLTIVLLQACGNQNMLTDLATTPDQNQNNGQQFDEPVAPPAIIPDPAIKPYCSDLSFAGVTWNTSLTPYERRSLAIALSLSGSFEGPNGWRNLTNNFDGMGLSAGLLNQTLGTSSLQPLLANLKKKNSAAFEVLESSRRSNFLNMIQQWESSQGYIAKSEEEVTSSQFDIPEQGITLRGEFQKLATPASTTVNWAVNNLYQGNGSFKPEWKTELMNLMGHPAYVTEQIAAAETIHKRASGYVTRLGMTSLRAYLLMFDICVQNGGLNATEFANLDAAIKAEGLASETAILKRLIEIRLQRVLPQWREDVRSRKFAIIDGSGAVHGVRRNFPKQYCFGQYDRVK